MTDSVWIFSNYFTESVLRQYCKLTGLQFVDTMLDWSDCPVDLALFKDWLPWLKGVLNSTRFHPSTTKKVDLSAYPACVKEAIDDNLPYYDYLHSKRIIP